MQALKVYIAPLNNFAQQSNQRLVYSPISSIVNFDFYITVGLYSYISVPWRFENVLFFYSIAFHRAMQGY